MHVGIRAEPSNLVPNSLTCPSPSPDNELQLNPAMSNSVISNRVGFPLNLPLFFQSFTMGYLELGYFEHPAISNCFSLPLAQVNHGYLELYYVRKKHCSTSVKKCSQGKMTRCTESWETYWRVHGNESKVRLTGLAVANTELRQQVAGICHFRDQSITTEILTPTSLSRTPAISNFFFDTLDSSR